MGANNDEIFRKLVATIENFLQMARERDVKEKTEITLKTDLSDDLGIDSLEAMDLIVEIEKCFNLSVEPKELLARRKVGDVVDYISQMKLSKS